MQKEDFEISVIITTYNRPDVLKKCFDALSSQTFDREKFEVIVADDGSENSMMCKQKEWLSESFKNSFYLYQENSGQGAGRNCAIGKACGKLLLFINDDTISDPELLERHVRMHQRYSQLGDAVLGKVTISPDVSYSFFNQFHLDSMYAQWSGGDDLGWKAFYTCNISVKRQFLLENGLFDPSLRAYEDIELGQRLSSRGLRIFYEPLALGYHEHSLSEADFFNYSRFYAKALAIWYKKAPHLKDELIDLGLYPMASTMTRFKHSLIFLVFNSWSVKFWIKVARLLTKSNEKVAEWIYRKAYLWMFHNSLLREMEESKIN